MNKERLAELWERWNSFFDAAADEGGTADRMPAFNRRDLSIVCGLAIFSMVLIRYIAVATGTGGAPLGSDWQLWCGEMLRLAEGSYAGPRVPPGFPWLVVAIRSIPGIDAVTAAQVVNELVLLILGPVAYVAGRSLGAGRVWSIVGAVATLSLPSLQVFAVQFQPDALTVLLLTGTVPVIIWYLDKPTNWRLFFAAVYGGAFFLFREHGLVVATLIGVIAFSLRAPLKTRVLRALLVAAVLICAPAFGGGGPSLPTGTSWFARVEMATSGTENFPNVSDPVGRARVEAHKQAHLKGDRLGVLYHHMLGAWLNTPKGWTWLLGAVILALVGLRGHRRIAALVPLIPSLPALVILSQDRHVEVATPAAIICLLTVAPKWKGARCWILVLLAAQLYGHELRSYSAKFARQLQRTQTLEYSDLPDENSCK